jgi:hypothetical protein
MSCFVVAELIQGQRGNFVTAFVLFGLGRFVSHGGLRLKASVLLRWAPVIAVLFWGFVKAEDVRGEFSRGTPENSAEALSRLDSLTGASPTDAGGKNLDADGVSMNAVFRVAARLFENSAVDVISRTPSDIPFWGWTDADWDDLLTGLLPLKLNGDASFLKDENAGVLFLRSYGWSNIDPSKGNAMPATLLADSWRRFGWIGVAAFFFVWAWVLTRTTAFLRSRPGLFTIVFAAALLPNTAFLYGQDVVGVASSALRRVMLSALYAMGVTALARTLWPGEGRRAVIGSARADLVTLPLKAET